MPNKEIWTQDRIKICDKLRQLRNDVPAQLYERIYDLLKVYSPLSPTGKVDLALIGHCVRELMNGFSEYLDGTDTVGNNKAAEQNAIERIRQVLFENYVDSSSIAEAAEVIPISSELANALGQFMDAAREGSNNNKKRASLAALDCVDEGNPALIPWFDVQNFFYNFVHINRRGVKELPDCDEVNKELSYLDNSLSTRLGFFFDTKSKLVDILGSTNTKTTDRCYLSPTDEMIESALSLIANRGLRFIFFSQLKNPEWLLPLKQRKVFKGVGETELQGLQFTSWPEKLYLVRVAAVYPKLVSKIILEISDVQDPVVRLALIEIMLSLPIEETFEMASKVIQWAEQVYCQNSYFWAAEEISALIRRLLTSDIKNARRLGKCLFQSCFMPRMTVDGLLYEVTALIPSYCYSDQFDNLSDAYYQILLSARRGMLSNFLLQLLPKLENNTDTRSSFLISSIEREVECHAKSITSEVIFRFAQVVLDSLNDNSNKAITWLKKKENNPLLTRCVFFVIERVLKGCYGEKGCVVNEYIANYVHDQLLSGLILEDEYDPELYPLLSIALEKGIIDSEEIDNMIRDSYKKKIEFYQLRYEELGNSDSWDAVKAAKRWAHRALSLIGPNQLGNASQQFFSELCMEISQKDYSPMHVRETETKVGPISPVDAAQMIDMGAESLLDHLIRWHPTYEDRINLISHQGQGQELEKIVAWQPSFFAGNCAKIELLRPTYQQAILDGWGKALKNKMDVPISDVLTILSAVSKMSETETWDPNCDSFDDANNLGVRRAAARLADYLLDSSNVSLSEVQSNQLIDALFGLVNSAEPSEEYEQKYGGDNQDPLTLAMNTIKPIALFAIAKWISRNVKNANVQIALDVIEKHFPHKSRLLSEAAAVGEALPFLYRVVPEWVEENYAKLFGVEIANTSQQVVLTTVLALFRPSLTFYNFLSPALLKAMDNHAELYAVGFRALNRDCLLSIGNWAYQLFVLGYIPFDDQVLRKWQSIADGKHLGLTLGTICGMLGSSKGDIADEVVYRVGELWDYHKNNLVSEAGNEALRGIVNLVRSRCFDTSWWGPRLLSELEISGNKISLGVIDGHLLALSEYDPELAVKVLQKIAERDHYPRLNRYSDIGLQLLQKAKHVNGGILSDAAQSCLDYLGSLGCLDLDEKLL